MCERATHQETAPTEAANYRSSGGAAHLETTDVCVIEWLVHIPTFVYIIVREVGTRKVKVEMPSETDIISHVYTSPLMASIVYYIELRSWISFRENRSVREWPWVWRSLNISDCLSSGKIRHICISGKVENDRFTMARKHISSDIFTAALLVFEAERRGQETTGHSESIKMNYSRLRLTHTRTEESIPPFDQLDMWNKVVKTTHIH